MGSFKPVQLTALQSLDKTVAEEPDRLYCVHPVSADIADGWKDVSFGDMAYATENMAFWIQSQVSVHNEPQALAYIGANDIRYSAFIFACMRLQHTPLLISPRNSEQASLHVMSATGCVKIFYSPERYRQVDGLKAADPSLQTWEVPSLWDVFSGVANNASANLIAPGHDVDERVALYIHSSGTTGLPKPVPLTNGYLKGLQNTGSLAAPPGRDNCFVMLSKPLNLCFVMSPFFHIMGLFNLFAPVLFGMPFLLSPDRPMTTELFSQIVREKHIESGFISPFILEELSSTDAGMETLSKFTKIVFSGAPLAPAIGDRISQVTHLQTVIGSSECFVHAALKHEDKADWNYHEWNPNYPIEMQDLGNDIHELVIPRANSIDIQPIFHTFPELQVYHTGDAFKPHPEKSGLWRYIGRIDDVIVLSNGEKFNPISMEGTISSHPFVSRVVIMGQGHFQSSALIQPNWDLWEGSRESLINEIWPVIQEANKTAPGHARLMRNRIGLASKEKPFQTTPKGTVQRRFVLEDYADEIEALYTTDDIDEDHPQIPGNASLPWIKSFISEFLQDTLSIVSNNDDADIFALGIDSLQTLQLGQFLQASLKSTQPNLVASALRSQQLYSHPTLHSLASYVLELLHGESSPSTPALAETDSLRASRLAGLVSKYSDDLGDSHVVILTGSTGSLGAYLLHELLRDLSVSKIYCLNRSPDAASRQLKSMQEKGLVTYKHFPRRVEFLQAEFGSERLGLEDERYDALLEDVDTIIHNAWKVNFNHRAEAFEDPHIQGVRRLVDFSIASERMAHIHFVSSISTIQGFSQKKGPSIPEVIYTDATVAARQGYGESKHVSERICAAASAKRGVPTSIHRVGQIGGPTTKMGMWNKQEWVPSLVATSKTIKQIPSSLGPVPIQWVPVDITAKVITDVVRTRRATEQDERCAAFHIVNPKLADWQSLVPTVAEYMDAEIVPLSQWLQTLDSFVSPTETDLQNKPALKILEFFKAIAMADENSPGIETLKTQEASKSLRQLDAIDAALMKDWMDQWNFE